MKAPGIRGHRRLIVSVQVGDQSPLPDVTVETVARGLS